MTSRRWTEITLGFLSFTDNSHVLFIKYHELYILEKNEDYEGVEAYENVKKKDIFHLMVEAWSCTNLWCTQKKKYFYYLSLDCRVLNLRETLFMNIFEIYSSIFLLEFTVTSTREFFKFYQNV